MSKNTDIKNILTTTKRAFVSVGLFSMFINILMLTGPIFMLQIYDGVLVSRSVPTLISLTVLMIVLYMFMGAFDLIRSRILSRIGTDMENTLNERAFNIRLQQGRYAADDSQASVLDDLSKFTRFFSSNAPTAFFDAPWTPLYLLLIFMLHWSLGVFALIGMAIVLIATMINAVSTKTPQKKAYNHKLNAQHMSDQLYRNAEEVVVLGMAKNLYNRWIKERNSASHYELLRGDRSSNMQSFSKSFRMFLQSGVLALGAWLAIQQTVTAGAVIAGSILLGRAISPLQAAIGNWQKLISMREAYRRLSEAYEEHPEHEQRQSLPAPQGHLSVEGVMAGPPGANMATLQGLNFALQPGDALGVIGPSASGKSTLAKLLVGAWIPQRGSIRLDGATFDQWNPEDLGQHIGYLPQKVEMFKGTVAENISRFTPNPQSGDVVAAAQMANVHELILTLPGGYQAQLGVNGAALSGGQVQRIALARALYGNPVLVVMDEPNSNLDKEGDAALSNAIKNLRSYGKTVIVMAHRASALTHVNKILKLKDGQQVVFGDKDKLSKKSNGSKQQTVPKQDTPTPQNGIVAPQNGTVPMPVRPVVTTQPPPAPSHIPVPKGPQSNPVPYQVPHQAPSNDQHAMKPIQSHGEDFTPQPFPQINAPTNGQAKSISIADMRRIAQNSNRLTPQ